MNYQNNFIHRYYSNEYLFRVIFRIPGFNDFKY